MEEEEGGQTGSSSDVVGTHEPSAASGGAGKGSSLLMYMVGLAAVGCLLAAGRKAFGGAAQGKPGRGAYAAPGSTGKSVAVAAVPLADEGLELQGADEPLVSAPQGGGGGMYGGHSPARSLSGASLGRASGAGVSRPSSSPRSIPMAARADEEDDVEEDDEDRWL